MTSLANKLQNLESFLKAQPRKGTGYGKALAEAIVSTDHSMEVEVLKSLGDLHLQRGKLSKDSAEFDKAAALYAAALLRCTDPDVEETLEHRIHYMEKLSRQLLQGYSPQYQKLSPDYRDTGDNNVLRVAEICHKLDKDIPKSQQSVEEVYTETLVTAIGNGDSFLERELLKSLGDLYLERGKKTLDVSKFSKAAAMYGKAVTSCQDPDTKLTLVHRILYVVKIWQLARRQLSLRKIGLEGRWPNARHESGNNTRTDVTLDQHLKIDIVPSQYKEHLKKGDFTLARLDLDSAEQHFGAALKMVHVRDSTAQQYQREVEPLCKLGDVYSKRGQQTGYGGDFVKAAALYNAAVARSEDQVLNGVIVNAIKEVETLFLKSVLGLPSNVIVNQDDIEKHKKQLKEMRDQIKLEMETIDQQLNPYVHDEDDPCVREIEAKRAQAVRQLFEKIAQQRKELISLLVEECIGLMGPSPCKYALIGLGSQATGLVTPYSDLEFAILVEEETKECLGYFHNLTHYLHLKVVNLGETILPALGIKSLNDFYSKNPLDSWYYDSVTPRGFAFDGSMPKASKTPLGRQGTENKPPSELICTPDKMVSKLQYDVMLYLKEGYHLATILKNPCLIAGDQDLIETYVGITEKILQADGGKMAQRLAQETMKEDIKTFSGMQTVTARLIDVKKEIYRFPALAVDYLALSSHIMPTTVWKTIDEMVNKQVISPNNAHHLTVLTSISAELRLRTYMANGGQKENLSALASIEAALHRQEQDDQKEADLKSLKPVFHLPNEKQLFRYYYTVVPLKKALSEWSKTERKQIRNSFPDLYDNSPTAQGMMYSELCKDRLAINCYDQALEKAEDTDQKMYLLSDLGNAWSGIGDYQKAISYCEQALQMHRGVYGHITAHPNIATSLNNLGLTWQKLGDHRKAISYLEQALQMKRSIYGQSKAHPDIATALNNLGGAWRALGYYEKAVSYYEQALQILVNIHDQSTPHPNIAGLLNNLGQAWLHMGDCKKATSYFGQALQMCRSIYGHTSAHPHIANLFNNLGGAWHNLKDHTTAIRYFEQALQIYSSIYGKRAMHPIIAELLNNLGTTWCSLNDHGKAIKYLEQALQMYTSIYGRGTAHPHVAGLLHNLGSTMCYVKKYTKAVKYLGQALQMYRVIYGESTAHSHIAGCLNNLATALQYVGDNAKAVGCYEQALYMCRRMYGQSTANPEMATTLANLGEACRDLGDYRKAISYFEQALDMKRCIYGPSLPHPDIAAVLNNLGVAWFCLGEHKKAISICQEALAMASRFYPKSHPMIKQIELVLSISR
ncbi:uncharacterized protein LOC144925091 [Branchiostoma floridae x Branchiostoma belcheri]